jgi:hypothetical protein
MPAGYVRAGSLSFAAGRSARTFDGQAVAACALSNIGRAPPFIGRYLPLVVDLPLDVV